MRAHVCLGCAGHDCCSGTIGSAGSPSNAAQNYKMKVVLYPFVMWYYNVIIFSVHVVIIYIYIYIIYRRIKRFESLKAFI